LIAADTSIAVAAALPWHTSHASARSSLAGRRPRALAQTAIETYSVLTRLPAPHRVSPDVALDVLDGTFSFPPLVLSPEGHVRLLELAAGKRPAGGAVYDAVLAAAALEAGATLLMLDRRAIRTYQLLGVDHRLVA
jgi:predicted nucleic acid-binding protein